MAGNDKLDKRWDESKDALVDAARKAGIDPEIMVKISGFESGFNSHARPVSSNPDKNKITQFDGTKAISSAYGYGQFLDATWNDMIHKYGEKYGVQNAENLTKAQTNAPEIRNNPTLQAAMLAEFTKENIAKGAKLGGPDADANVYAFHNLGDGDATKFLKAMKENPNQRADQVLSASVISGNPSLYGDGSRSLADSYKAMGQKMDAYQKYADEARTMTGGQPSKPEPTTPEPTKPEPKPAQNQSNWPAPGNFKINDADKPGEGHGEFGTSRGGGTRTHKGVDIEGKVGDPIESFRPGTVIAVKPNNGAAGNMVTIDHGNGLTSTYMHLDKIHAKVGQKVPEDIEVIGTMGRTGNTPKQGDTHLHFEIRQNGVAVDPMPYLKGAKDLDSPAAAKTELKHGDKGAQVEGLQNRLNELGYTDAAGKKLKPDSDFGDRTQQAVEQFQRENGLKVTGVADKETLRLVDKGMTRHAAADGQLQPGEKGPDVRGFQASLNELGFKGADGKPLKVDGDYGDNTKAAVTAFQKANGLPETGVADRATLDKVGESLTRKEQTERTTPERTPAQTTGHEQPVDRTPREPAAPTPQTPQINDPKHPDNKLYTQAVANLEQMGPNGGFKSREEMERAAGALAADAKLSGLTQIDHVTRSKNGEGLIAVQGADPWAADAKRAFIDANQAANQPVDQSTRMADSKKPEQTNAQQPNQPRMDGVDSPVQKDETQTKPKSVMV